MISNNSKHDSYFKLGLLIPVISILIFGFACVNTENEDNGLKKNELYNYALNPIELGKYHIDSLVSSNGYFYKEDDQLFIMPNKIGSLYINTKSGKRLKEYLVIDFPNPKLEIGGEIYKEYDALKIDNIIVNTELHLYFNEVNWPTVMFNQYSIFYNKGKEDEKEFIINDWVLGNKEIEIIKKGISENMKVSIGNFYCRNIDYEIKDFDMIYCE